LPTTGGGVLCPVKQQDTKPVTDVDIGVDTLWASGYEIYDRISEPYQKFLETLTATFEQPGFQKVAEAAGFKLYDKPRGAAENVGTELKAVHPVVRTNPVTGWKSIFPVGGHVKHINGLTEEESTKLLTWFLDLVYKNHDLQVRFKWKNPNDIGGSPKPFDAVS
jgi:alpha-ketoglutarate-dependent taurine dioxygenase